jgi:chromate transporter
VSEAVEGTRPAVAEVSLSAIFVAFFRLGCVSFGGSSVGWIHRDIVRRRGWVSDQQFLIEMAVGQSLPGANGVKLAVLLGRQLKGGLGALAAPLAFLLGPFFIILAVGGAYSQLGDHGYVHAALDGIAGAVVGLTFSTGIGTVARGAREPVAIVITAATVLCVGILGWPMLPVMLVLAPISIGLAFARARSRLDA